MPSVLLVEDDQTIRQRLTEYLTSRGFSVETSATGMEAVHLATAGNYDIIVLDLGLPDIDGTQALKMIRSVSTVPVVVATARDDEAEIVAVLGSGADDYVVKPFSGAQIEARITAIMRRVNAGAVSGPIHIGDLTIDTQTREAAMAGSPIDLTRKEFDFLAYLAERTGVVVSKRELLAEVWRQPYGGADKTIDVHLSVLRRKLGESASQPQYLQTVHSVGIKLVDPTS